MQTDLIEKGKNNDLIIDDMYDEISSIILNNKNKMIYQINNTLVETNFMIGGMNEENCVLFLGVCLFCIRWDWCCTADFINCSFSIACCILFCEIFWKVACMVSGNKIIWRKSWRLCGWKWNAKTGKDTYYVYSDSINEYWIHSDE